MIGKWPVLSQTIIGEIIDLETKLVLAEYNGPQIILAEARGDYFLGVAADGNDNAVRWIFSQVTPLELRALAAGAQTTRDALLKREVFVIDYDYDDQISRAWHVLSDQIEEHALPKPGAALPSGSRQLLEEFFPANASRSEIALEQLNYKLPGIPFKTLSQAISVIQRLWIAMAAAGEMAARGRYVAGLEERATLSFVEASTGSLRIHVEPRDELLFQDVSETFSDLVQAGDDHKKVSEILKKAGPRVQARYRELLVTMQRNDLELMTTGADGFTFLGPDKAGRILHALLQEKDTETSIVYAVGCFLTYSSVDKRFEFGESDSERRFKGEVESDVLLRNRAITVGDDVSYSVIIEVTKTMESSNEPNEQHRLRAAVELNADTSGAQTE